MLDEKDQKSGLAGGAPGVFPVGTGLGGGAIPGVTVGGLGSPMAPVIGGVPDVGDVSNPNDAIDDDMPMDNDDVISTLNNLIATCYDGEYGFKSCTERTKSTHLKTVFEERARDCASSAAELGNEVVRLGGTPETSGTVSGTMHRGWVAVKEMLTSGADSDLSVLEECERGEDGALARYRKAMKEALPSESRAIVERQLQGVQRNHDMVKQLRDSHKLQQETR